MVKIIQHIISFRLKHFIKKVINSDLFCKIKLQYILPMGYYDEAYLNTPLEDSWIERITDVIDCPDNRLIERHPEAGMIKKGKVKAHFNCLLTLFLHIWCWEDQLAVFF